MRWLLVMAMLVGTRVAEAKPVAPAVDVAARLSAQIGAKPPTLTITLTSNWTGPIPLAKPVDAACWLPLYFRGAVERLDGSAVAKLEACKKSRVEIIELQKGESVSVEVPLAKVFKKIPRGTFQLDLAWTSEGAVARDHKLALRSATPQQVLRFTVAKLVKTVTIKRDATAALAKGVTLGLTGHGHETPEGPGESALIAAFTITQGGTTQEHTVTVNGEHVPFALGEHVISMVSYQYDREMTLRYWGTIALSP